MAWEEAIFARGRCGSREADGWDEAQGSWRVSEAQARLLLDVIEQLPATYFGRSMGSQDLGPSVVGTVVGQAVDPADAQAVKRQAADFLRGGGFAWRFISI
jgi:hypothetical protein